MTQLSGWRRGRLGEECSIEIGGTPSRNIPAYWDDTKDMTNLWVAIKDLNRRVITETAEQITALGVKHSNVKLQAKGTVLLSFKLSIGRVAEAGLPVYTNEAIAGLRSKRIVHEYLYYGLQQWDLLQAVDQAIKGATLNKEKLKKIEFDFPEAIPEQARIAEVLSAVDQAIEQTDAVIGKQQRIRTGLMQDLLKRGIDQHGRVRSEKTHKFKDSALGRIPEEWKIASLGDLFEQRQERGKRGLPVMSIVMKDGLVERASVERRVESNLPAEGHALVVKGDIAYNMMRMWQGVLGRALFDCLISPAYVVLKPRETINTHFAEWLFRDERSILKFRRASRGVVDDRLRLYAHDLFAIEFAIPDCLDEQESIAQRLDAVKDRIAKETATLEKYRRIRVGLMQDLLSGTKRVTNLLAIGPKLEKVYAGQ
jgi:type I restriction enzyme S subunit